MSRASGAPDRERTFRSVYEAVYPDLLRFVQRRAGPDHAEDVVADAFLVVWRRLDELPRHPDDARAWIFGIARNLLLNDHRAARRRHALGVRLADAAAHPAVDPAVDAVVDADPAEVVGAADVGRAWRRLSATHQEALVLAVIEELNAPRAAAVLGISPVAFRLRLSRARRALRLHLDHLPPAPSPAGAERRTALS
jgi:RNA polymerase sigma-70 factor (ECF subfamily)